MSESQRRSPLAVAALASLAAAAASAPGDAQGTDEGVVFENSAGDLRVRLREERIAFTERGMTIDRIHMSPDGRSVALLMSGGGEVYVELNGKPGPTFEGVAEGSIVFSPDGSRLAFVATRDGKKYVVVDEVLYEHDEISEAGVVFSADGARFAWVAGTRDGKQVAVIDGEPQTTFDGIAPYGVLFSPDGERHAYVARDGETSRVVLDGDAGPAFDQILSIVWSSVGAHLGYIASSGDKRVVSYDHEIVAEVDGIGLGGFSFPAAGDRYAVVVQRDDVWSCLIDGELIGDYLRIVTPAKFSDDGSRYAYVAVREGRAVVVDNGEELEARGPSPPVSLSPDGKHLAFVRRARDKRAVSLDGVVGPPFQLIMEPGVIFSEDSARSAYCAQRGENKFLVVDGEPGPPFRQLGSVQPQFVAGRLVYTIARRGRGESLVIDREETQAYDQIFGPSFTPDGRHHAFIGERDGTYGAIIDGQEIATYAHAPGAPLFSPDGKHLAYVAGRDREVFVVLDGIEGTHFDHIAPSTLAFTPNSEHLVHVAANGDRRFIVIDDLVIDNDYQGFLRGGGVLIEDDRNLIVRAGRNQVWYLVRLEILAD